ncbi:MAG: hypothetical protein U1E17_09415 [Geminicoccaceae bacterium]
MGQELDEVALVRLLVALEIAGRGLDRDDAVDQAQFHDARIVVEAGALDEAGRKDATVSSISRMAMALVAAN